MIQIVSMLYLVANSFGVIAPYLVLTFVLGLGIRAYVVNPAYVRIEENPGEAQEMHKK